MHMLWWIVLVLSVIAVDQASKTVVINKIALGSEIKLIENFFYLTHVENSGAAWSIFQNGRYFFIVLTILVAIVICYLLFKAEDRLFITSLSFILGGAVGNLIDRVMRGTVTDFFGVWLGSYRFPVFNIADSFIVTGVILLAYYLLFVHKESL